MTYRIGRGGYRQWGVGVSWTPAREGGWARVGWEVCLAFGPWVLKVYGSHAETCRVSRAERGR